MCNYSSIKYFNYFNNFMDKAKIKQIAEKHARKINDLRAKQSKLVKEFFNIVDKEKIEKIRKEINKNN